MARGRERETDEADTVRLSLIGPGTRIVGDCVSEGTVRVEGSLVGSVYAGQAVVVAKGGSVQGEIRTQDALIAGEASGVLVAASRLEIQATARVEGEIRTLRLLLADGAVLNGDLQMGEVELGAPPQPHPARLRRATISTEEGGEITLGATKTA